MNDAASTVPLGGRTNLSAEVRMLAHWLADDWDKLERETHAELLEQTAQTLDSTEQLKGRMGAMLIAIKHDPDCSRFAAYNAEAAALLSELLSPERVKAIEKAHLARR